MDRMRAERWLAWLPLGYLVLFFVIPTSIVVGCTFFTRDYYGGVVFTPSIEGWRQALDSYTREVLLRSCLLAAGVTLACLVLGYPAAMVMSRLPASWRRIAIVLFAFPLITSLLLRIYGWINLLPLSWRGNIWSVGLVLAFNYFPFMLLPLLRAFERLDASLPRAAQDLGATPWQSFWHVSFPLTRPGMVAGCALVFIPAAGDYLIPHFIGEGHVNVIGTLIVHQFGEGRNWPYGAAAAACLLGLVLLPLVVTLTRRSPALARTIQTAKGHGP